MGRQAAGVPPIRHAWRVEVAHGRLGRSRRLAKSFENTTTSATGWRQRRQGRLGTQNHVSTAGCYEWQVRRADTRRVLSATDPAVAWLLDAGDQAVRALACRELLGRPTSAEAAMSSPLVQTLLTNPFRTNPYAKWSGAHWRLVSLVELGVPAGQPEALAVCDLVLDHWATPQRLAKVPVVNGLARRCASQEGNAVASACRIGLAEDPRVTVLVEHLLAWQWPDGGWNCDPRPRATHSSVHETLPALWGLHEYGAATGDSTCETAVGAASELLLRHHVVYSRRTGQPIHPSVLQPHYPPYWHYDLLQALLILGRAGFADDSRTAKARQVLSARRRKDGRWRAVRPWWRAPGETGSGVEAVDWADVAHQMVTLNALRVGAGEPG